MTREVATIGFGKKGAERFVELLRDADIQCVVDIRRRPDSPLAGYARQRDLPFLLAHAAKIRYEHQPQLAPPNALLERYRKDKDWEGYVRDFEEVLASAAAITSMRDLLERSERIVLLCSEPTPEKCHRRLVAERMQAMDPDLGITHLT